MKQRQHPPVIVRQMPVFAISGDKVFKKSINVGFVSKPIRCNRKVVNAESIARIVVINDHRTGVGNENVVRKRVSMNETVVGPVSLELREVIARHLPNVAEQFGVLCRQSCNFPESAPKWPSAEKPVDVPRRSEKPRRQREFVGRTVKTCQCGPDLPIPMRDRHRVLGHADMMPRDPSEQCRMPQRRGCDGKLAVIGEQGGRDRKTLIGKTAQPEHL